MEQFLLQHAERFKRYVGEFKPPPTPKAANGTHRDPNPAMIVTTRIRPQLSDESGLPPAIFARPSDPGVVDVHELRQPVRGPPVLKSCNFRADRVFDADATTEEIYEEVVKPIIPWAWDGGIGTLFAYGQTGSGKTYTISQLEKLVALELLSGKLEGKRNLFITIIELAGDAAYDLLTDRRSVRILEDSFGTMQLTGASEHQLSSTEEMLDFIEKATAFRRTAATVKNDASSRSHSICRIRIQNPATPEAEEGLLYLIDLAGSEAARDKASHDEQRMKEAVEINTSLSVLKDCMRGKAEADALIGTAASKRKPHVPFRRSSLTKILKHVFDPAAARPSRTIVIGCINPGLGDAGPGKNTLRYVETLRVIIPKAKPAKYDPLKPTSWSNDKLQEWIAVNSGSPAVDAVKLAPVETGIQLLRLPWQEFDRRCMETKGVTEEQVHAFHSKLWQLHMESQRATPSVPSTPALDDLALRSSSRDPDPKAAAVKFKDRLRPGMVVSWSPPRDFKFRLDGLNMALILSADKTAGHYICSLVTPGIMPGAYDVNLWRQAVIDSHVMEAEVILEYDEATRYYYIAV